MTQPLWVSIFLSVMGDNNTYLTASLCRSNESVTVKSWHIDPAHGNAANSVLSLCMVASYQPHSVASLLFRSVVLNVPQGYFGNLCSGHLPQQRGSQWTGIGGGVWDSPPQRRAVSIASNWFTSWPPPPPPRMQVERHLACAELCSVCQGALNMSLSSHTVHVGQARSQRVCVDFTKHQPPFGNHISDGDAARHSRR